MFSKSVVQSGRFLRLPPTARLLYYDLGMAADDDGVAEGFLVLRSTGASEDDLHALAARGFITVLNEDLVCCLNDWKRSNRIPKDRYHPSVYAALIRAIAGEPQDDAEAGEDGTQDGNAPSAECIQDGNDLLTECIQDGNDLSTECIQDGDNLYTEDRSGKDRSGKDSTGQEKAEESGERRSRGKTAKRFSPPSLEEVEAYCLSRDNGVEPQVFLDFYASKGWKVGREPMRDWKAAVRTWETRDRQRARASPSQGITALPTQEEYEKGWEDYYE